MAGKNDASVPSRRELLKVSGLSLACLIFGRSTATQPQTYPTYIVPPEGLQAIPSNPPVFNNDPILPLRPFSVTPDAQQTGTSGAEQLKPLYWVGRLEISHSRTRDFELEIEITGDTTGIFVDAGDKVRRFRIKDLAGQATSETSNFAFLAAPNSSGTRLLAARVRRLWKHQGRNFITNWEDVDILFALGHRE